MILEGFVCYGCFKLLSTYHEKRELLLTKLDGVIEGTMAGTTSGPAAATPSRERRVTTSADQTNSSKRKKVSHRTADKTSQSPEVTVSNYSMYVR